MICSKLGHRGTTPFTGSMAAFCVRLLNMMVYRSLYSGQTWKRVLFLFHTEASKSVKQPEWTYADTFF